jgi:hypothetical protein
VAVAAIDDRGAREQRAVAWLSRAYGIAIAVMLLLTVARSSDLRRRRRVR